MILIDSILSFILPFLDEGNIPEEKRKDDLSHEEWIAGDITEKMRMYMLEEAEKQATWRKEKNRRGRIGF